MKNLIKFAFTALLIFTAISCSDDDDTTTTPPVSDETIADIVADNENYSSLLAALQKTGLDATLNGSGTFTVFAPNNDAFSEFLDGASLDDVSDDVLSQILLNHVLGTTQTSDQLTTGYVTNLAKNEDGDNLSMYINTTSGVVQINGVATVTQADVPATNGVVHFVDEVIPVPTVTTFATADATFSTLVTALTDLTPDTNYAGILSSTDNAPFTVFAPTNTAFDDLLTRFGLTDFTPLTAAQIEIVLNYHVLAGLNVRSSDLAGIPDGVTPPTLQGETLLLNLEEGVFLRDKTGVDAEIVVVDVQAANGVIHVVDKVLLPNAALDALGKSITAFAYNGGEASDFSSLYVALRKTGLNDVLDDATLRTVFAPDNDSFATFLGGTALEDVSNDVLIQILLNHVVSGKLESGDFTTSYKNTLATYGDTDANLSLYVNTGDGLILNGGADNGGATVIAANNSVRNGVIHVVDSVIELPTVVTFAVADANFSTLVSALTELTPSTDYVSILTASGGTSSDPFTVFAPVNSAFDAIDVPSDESVLASILNYHVVDGANVRSSDLENGTVTTLNGDVTINTNGPTVTGAGNMSASNIIAADVQASNGVIHAIDQVLLPAM